MLTHVKHLKRTVEEESLTLYKLFPSNWSVKNWLKMEVGETEERGIINVYLHLLPLRESRSDNSIC